MLAEWESQRRYINRPELNEERFIANPFIGEDEFEKAYDRLYKTGDLVRWTEDGELEFLGVMIFRLKFEDIRVELGEIEQAIPRISGVNQVVVQDRKTSEGHTYLAAWFVADGSLSASVIQRHLSDKLPPYMIPSAFVALQEFP